MKGKLQSRIWRNFPEPLIKQIEPVFEEIEGEGVHDFCEERKFKKGNYLIHKYPDRAVLLLTNQCFAYCRFCFRRYLWKEKPLKNNDPEIKRIIKYISQHIEIKDLILSGGDPLTLTNQALNNWVKLINQVKHIKLIRIATRALTFYPARINSGLLSIFRQSKKQVWFLSHFNHPAELTPLARTGIKKIKDSGVPVLNQTVLLRGVNDRAEILLELFQELSSLGVKPYYVFQCDPVPGATHYWTELGKSLDLMNELSNYSGIMVPKFALEVPGYGKLCPGPGWQIARKENRYEIVSPAGEKYKYPAVSSR